MTWEAWATLVTIALLLYGLARKLAAPDVLLMGGLTLLTTLSIWSDRLPSPGQVAAAFGNEGLLTVGVLFVVAAGLTETGGIQLVGERLLGRPRSVVDAQTRLMVPVAIASAFLNNTPIVAMFLPAVTERCTRTGQPVEAALAAGRSLVASARLSARARRWSCRGFSSTPIGPTRRSRPFECLRLVRSDCQPRCSASGTCCWSRRGYSPNESRRGRSCPTRASTRWPCAWSPGRGRRQSDDPAGGAATPAGHVSGGHRAERRNAGRGRTRAGASRKRPADLRRRRRVGGRPAPNSRPALGRRARCHADGAALQRGTGRAVVSPTCPLLGTTIRDGQFRTRYGAVVIAVHRNGERVHCKLGDIVLRAGDTLLLETDRRFLHTHSHSRDFFLVSAVPNSHAMRHDRGWLAASILAGMVLVVAFEDYTRVTVFQAALVAAALMGLTRCCSAEQARRSIDWSTLAAIGAALGIGHAIERSGLADQFARYMIAWCYPLGPWAVLAGVYVITLLFTEAVTNNAAAALAFPIARAAAAGLDVNLLPFAIAVAVGASAGFATPLGYQTHLMVYGPGGYRFKDYVKIGAPMDLLVMAVTIGLTPLIFPFA